MKKQSLNRRGFLSLAGGAVAATPALAAEVKEVTFSPPLRHTHGPFPTSALSDRGELVGLKEHLASLKKLLAENDENAAREMSWREVRLDPDLLQNRSMSLSARYRCQAQRNLERYKLSRSEELKKDIARVVNQIAGLGG